MEVGRGCAQGERGGRRVRRGGQELTQKEVADMLGISQSYISRLEKKIIERLKERIENSL